MQKAPEYWKQLLADFVVTANTYRQYAYSKSQAKGEFMRRLIVHSNMATFASNYLTLSPQQKDFVREICRAGVYAQTYNDQIKFASEYSNLGKDADANRCFREADDNCNGAVQHFDQAVRAYNNMQK